jgi:tetratricopeptide (TPR) repeat protein
MCLDLALALAHLGQVWLEQQRARQAEPIYDRALALVTHQEVPYFSGMNLIHAARLYETIGAFNRVRQLADDALRLARTSNQLKQVELPALVFLIHARLAVQQLDASGAVRELEWLAAEWPDERDQAAIHDELGRLHPDLARARQHGTVAAALYRKLYHRTRLIQYRQRYEALTGETLADPVQIPAPPAIITAHPLDLEALLARVDHLIAADGP